MWWILRTLKDSWKAHHRFSNNSNHFVMLDYLMTGSGIRLQSGWEWNGKLYRAVRLCVIFATAFRCVIFWRNCSQWESLGSLLNNLHVLMAVAITLGRAACIQANMKEYTAAKSYINGRGFRPHDNRSTEIRRKTYQQIHSLATFCVIIQATVYVPLLAIDLRRIPAIRHPIEVREWTSDWFQFLVDKVNTIIIFPYGAQGVTNILTIYMLLKGFIDELQIIANSFGEIFNSIPNQTEMDFWRTLLVNYKTCAEQHVTCLDRLRKIRSLLNGTLLIMYFSTGFFISSGTMYIMLSKQLDMFKIQILYVITFNVLECFCFSALVEHINQVVRSKKSFNNLEQQ